MRISRRDFVRVGAAAAAALALPRPARSASYVVGGARGTDPYTTAARAIDYSGEWPATLLPGRTVVVKPNLVMEATAETGAVTDPEVVRAVVDRALADGAARVLIVESSPRGAFFSACGYDFFGSYDARVALVDLSQESLTLAPVPGGTAFTAIYTPALVMDPAVVYITVAKMKTHAEGTVTLALKNQFGLPDVRGYLSTFLPVGRFGMHDRSVYQTIADLNRMRPAHFALIDGIWAMEGRGPLNGEPVAMNTVLAGSNALAVDRVGLSLMGVGDQVVPHVLHAAAGGLGPRRLSEVTVTGDPLQSRAFVLPTIAPNPAVPRPRSDSFSPSSGGSVAIRFWRPAECRRQLDVVLAPDDPPSVQLVRTLVPRTLRRAGGEWRSWDGRGDDGSIVPPGRYGLRDTAWSLDGWTRPASAIGWVSVI